MCVASVGIKVKRVFACALTVGLWAGSAAGAIVQGSIVDPTSYGSSLGSRTLNSGTLSIDTGGVTPTISYVGTGVDVGTDFNLNGLTDASASGLVELAIFNFDQLSIGTGVSVSISGTRGAVLASKSNLSLNTAISVNGANATGASGGAGGSGSEGGPRNGATASAPPPTGAGAGGNGVTVFAGSGATGKGVGGGSGGSGDVVNSDTGAYSSGAGGGSYGGTGGTGQRATASPGTATAGTGGNPYGSSSLVDLYGGSGGGGGARGSSPAAGGGGGGGGALSLVAEGTLTLGASAQLRAVGGTGGVGPTTGNPVGGGGGSGGGILLAADVIDFSATLDVRGGNGGFNTVSADRPGGGGGGGRAALYYNTLLGATPVVGTNVLLTGGATEGSATAGGTGSLFTNAAPSYLNVPEPGVFSLIGIGGLGLLARRRRARH